MRNARSFFDAGNYNASIEELKALVALENNDQLLYLMDLGLVYHTAGNYSESIETFLKADKLAEIKNYTSLSEETASVVFSEELKAYRGEHFEKILINVYLAMGYTLSGKWEDALVECRRVNHKLDLMISEGKLPYEQNAFAKYLAAALFEARHEWNDAFVDYRTLLNWKFDFPYLGLGLLRVADKLRAEQELEAYQKKYSEIKNYRQAKDAGEILLLLEQGKSPIKAANPAFRLLPLFQRRHYESDHAWLRVGGARAKTYPLFDIENTAIKELNHRMALITAKKIAGVAAKEVLAHQVAKQTNNKALGQLTSLLLHATDSADLRSWTTLPARLQLARLSLPAGRHEVFIDMVGRSGAETKAIKRWETVEIKPGTITFLNYRMAN